jgi:hypothetical protein
MTDQAAVSPAAVPASPAAATTDGPASPPARTAPRSFETDTHESFLVFRRFFFMKLATVLCLVSIVAYALHSPLQPPSGGTWLGYTLGTTGAGLIYWLTWFGYRKRSYASAAGRVQAWLSAHVYLGLSLIVVATLHTGFQFGWNVHTLAYALMMLVIASGAFGVFAYTRYPALMTSNRRGMTMGQMLSRVATLDGEARQTAMGLSDEIALVVAHANQATRVGGSAWRQLTGRDPSCATAAALRQVQQMVKRLPPKQEAAARTLLILLSQKVEYLERIRRDIQYKAIMDIWLYLHVPLTFGLLAALTAHIVSVFFYW